MLSSLTHRSIPSAVNAVDLDSYVTQLNTTDTSAASKTILSYRTVRRKVTVVHWEVCMTEVRSLGRGGHLSTIYN